jgi:hypothetical protein
MGTSAGVLEFRRDGHLGWLNRRAAYEVLSVDFQADSPNVVFAGERTGQLRMVDLRAPADVWERPAPVRHRGAVAHVRSLNEYQVLAAGPRSALSVYDVRYQDRRPNGRLPLLAFPAYRNESHVHIGFDVQPEHGVVAAAHDDGTVSIYSLYSGRRLRCAAVDDVAAEGVIKCLMFQTLPHDRNPSLFIGVGPNIQKYSFGVHGMDEE